jgi:hypothetical protein
MSPLFGASWKCVSHLQRLCLLPISHEARLGISMCCLAPLETKQSSPGDRPPISNLSSNSPTVRSVAAFVVNTGAHEAQPMQIRLDSLGA